MSVRIHCRACRTAFVTPDGPSARPVACPKCGAVQSRAPAPKPAPAAPTTEGSVFVPSDDARRPRRFRRAAWAGVGVLAVAALGVGLVVAWPALRAWWRPVPPDPVESVATAYLTALVENNEDAARRLGTLDLPPAIRTFRAVKHDPTLDDRTRGSFAPVAAFHARINEAYAYDPSVGRFTPRNALGPAAETLDAIHEAKAKAEKEGLYKKMQSGDPDDLFDAAESLGKTMSALAEGALAPKKLVPTYKQLVDDAKPPLPADARALALDYAANREAWDAMLKRPFLTLKADGPFLLERAEVTAPVIDALGSLGDPPTTLHLTLTRFRLEGIDTGWRVTSARREGQPPARKPEAGPAGEAPKTSPGKAVSERPY